jgi:hypothetical protein
MTERNTLNNALRALLAIITAYFLLNQSISDKEKKSLMRLTPARFKKLETLFALKLGEKDGIILDLALVQCSRFNLIKTNNYLLFGGFLGIENRSKNFQ